MTEPKSTGLYCCGEVRETKFCAGCGFELLSTGEPRTGFEKLKADNFDLLRTISELRFSNDSLTSMIDRQKIEIVDVLTSERDVLTAKLRDSEAEASRLRSRLAKKCRELVKLKHPAIARRIVDTSPIIQRCDEVLL